jgi:hypothetical protein
MIYSIAQRLIVEQDGMGYFNNMERISVSAGKDLM